MILRRLKAFHPGQMVYLRQRKQYDNKVKDTMNRFLRILGIIAGIFLVTAITVFILARFNPAEGMSLLSSSVLAAGIVAGLSIPVLLWLGMKAPSLNSYSGFALEEVDINETELSEAVSNWLYVHRRKRLEGELRFLEDDDGNVTCRATVRKDS
jgi:hypothetical protein